MENYLIFNLYGPMVAWGNIAVGGERPSYRYPTKSAMIGLLAAALGIKRDEEERLQTLHKKIKFAVRLDAQGRPIIDYHTSQVPTKAALKNKPHVTRRDELILPELATILSNREYYCDCLYTIALWVESDVDLLSQLKDSLKNPHFVLYLGRKSCPLGLPIVPYLYKAQTLVEAYSYYDDEDSSQAIYKLLGQLMDKNNVKHLYNDVEINTGISGGYEATIIRRDQLLSRLRWQYTDREEKMTLLKQMGE